MFSIAHYDVGGKTTLVARVKRLDDGLWWDATGAAWVASESTSCNTTLPEGTTSGKYEGNAALVPSNGVTYEVYIYDGTTYYQKTRLVSIANSKTALQIVNDIQAGLRMPISTDFTGPHAKLVLAQLNDAIDFACSEAEWPEMNMEMQFVSKTGISVYSIRPSNSATVEHIEDVQVEGSSEPMAIATDRDFVAYRNKNRSIQGEPQYYRIMARAGGTLVIEVAPIPDAAYSIDVRAILAPSRMSLVDDVPLLNSELAYLGGVAFAKHEQGMDYGDDLGKFKAMVAGRSENQSEPNWTSVETP